MAPKKQQTARNGNGGGARGTKRNAPNDSASGQEKKAKTRQTSKKAQQELESPVELSSDDKSKLIKWLLGDEAFHLAYPRIPAGKGEMDLPKSQMGRVPPKNLDPDNADDAKEKRAMEVADAPNDDDYLTYPSHELTPFQTLLTSYLLSSPISHTLSLRTIGVLLNRPFKLRTPKAIEDAGEDGRREVLWTARTQHKEKTASQLATLVEGVRDICGNSGNDQDEEDAVNLKTVLDEAHRASDMKESNGDKSTVARRTRTREALLAQLTPIKGIGPGACEIFFRNIQPHIEPLYPYLDARCLNYAWQVGLSDKSCKDNKEDLDVQLQGADELRDALKLSMDEGQDEKAERWAFVRLVNVLIGLGLEGQLDKAREHVGAETAAGKGASKERDGNGKVESEEADAGANSEDTAEDD